MSATMSILGLYEYDKTLFNDMQLPAGVSRETLVNNLVIECAELELVYPSLSFLHQTIPVWSAKMLHTWTRLAEADAAEYNPIENYDRREDWSDSSQSSSDSTGKVSAFNSSEFENRDKREDTGHAVSNHGGRVHGNIGVTTAAQMLAGELEIRPRVNIYNVIIDDFKRRFCLLVY